LKFYRIIRIHTKERKKNALPNLFMESGVSNLKNEYSPILRGDKKRIMATRPRPIMSPGPV